MGIFNRWVLQRRTIASLERKVFQATVRNRELAQRLADLRHECLQHDQEHLEVREHLEAVTTRLGAKLTAREELLRQMIIAVGRVQVLKGQAVSTFEGLPRVVSMVVADHEDLESRIQAVVDYLRSFGPDETPVVAAELREQVGRLLQGAEPVIVDMQANKVRED